MTLVDRLVDCGLDLSSVVGVITVIINEDGSKECVDAYLGHVTVGVPNVITTGENFWDYDPEFDLILVQNFLGSTSSRTVSLIGGSCLFEVEKGLIIKHVTSEQHIGQSDDFIQETCEFIAALMLPD